MCLNRVGLLPACKSAAARTKSLCQARLFSVFGCNTVGGSMEELRKASGCDILHRSWVGLKIDGMVEYSFEVETNVRRLSGTYIVDFAVPVSLN